MGYETTPFITSISIDILSKYLKLCIPHTRTPCQKWNHVMQSVHELRCWRRLRFFKCGCIKSAGNHQLPDCKCVFIFRKISTGCSKMAHCFSQLVQTMHRMPYMSTISCRIPSLEMTHVCILIPDTLILTQCLVTSLDVQTTDICSFERHDDVVKWKHFPRYWPSVRGNHRLPVNSPHKG